MSSDSGDSVPENAGEEVVQSFHIFPNPLEICLGKGTIGCTLFTDNDGGGGIRFSYGDGSEHEVGSERHEVSDGTPQPNEVWLRCANIESARVLRSLAHTIVTRMEDAEAGHSND